MSQNSLKNKIKLTLKLALTVALLYYVTSLINIDELKPLFADLDVTLLSAAIFTHMLAFLVMSIRWWLILVSDGNDVRYINIIHAYYLGLFCNNFLPTAMGGDVVRIAILRSDGFHTEQLIFSTLADRVIGLLSILILGLVGINFSVSIQENIGNELLFTINIISGTAIVLFFVMSISEVRHTIFNLTIERIPLWTRVKNFLVYCNKNIDHLKKDTVFLKAILLSLVSQLLIVFTYYLIGKSLHIDLALMEYILIVPVVALFSSLPISVGGLGVREGVLVFLLGTVGISTTHSASISLLYLSILVLITVPGGIFLTFKRKVDKSCVLPD